jgi:hypothetical protein
MLFSLVLNFLVARTLLRSINRSDALCQEWQFVIRDDSCRDGLWYAAKQTADQSLVASAGPAAPSTKTSTKRS